MSESEREAAHTPVEQERCACKRYGYLQSARDFIAEHDRRADDAGRAVVILRSFVQSADKCTAPDLAAEVERLREEAASFHMDYRMKCDEETKRLAVEVEGLRATLDAERRKVEALRSASVGSRGWLVEWRYHGSVQWLYLWSAACGGFSFTADASEALRLARREDAEAVLEWARDTDSRRGLHSGTFLVTEHVWESAALASTEGGA